MKILALSFHCLDHIKHLHFNPAVRKVDHAKVGCIFVSAIRLLKHFVLYEIRISWGVEHILLHCNDKTVQFLPDLDVFEKCLIYLIITPNLVTSLDYHIFDCFSH